MHINISNMTDEQLCKFLVLIYPSNTINRNILHELKIRNIKNNLLVLKYLLHLKKINFDIWTVNRLLLILYEETHNSNKFIENKFTINFLKVKYCIKKVIKSIKKKELSEDFKNFIKLLENVILLFNKGTDQSKIKFLIENPNFVINLLEIYEKIKFRSKCIFKPLHVYFKETWLYIITDKDTFDQILFLILVNTDNSNDLKIKIINSSLKKILFNKNHEREYEELYYIVKDLESRYKSYYVNGKLDFENIKNEKKRFYASKIHNEEKIEEIEFFVEKAPKTTDKKCLEWYNMRKFN